MQRRSFKLAAAFAAAIAVLVFAAAAGRILVVNRPEPSDAILVLNGGTWERVQLGLVLLRQGMARRMIIETDAEGLDWGVPEAQLARQWIANLPAPESSAVRACPMVSYSTRQDARLVQPCLGDARRVLIVTSQYHTRRALAIFRHRDPTRFYSIAGAGEPDYFGVNWWQKREWAKTVIGEWGKLLWWETVDRWR